MGTEYERIQERNLEFFLTNNFKDGPATLQKAKGVLLPLHQPIHKFQHSSRHIFYSPKLGRSVYAYSSLEWNGLTLLEADPAVLFYVEQPVAAIVNVDGRPTKTTFDAFAVYANSVKLFEFKYWVDQEKGGTAGRQIVAQQLLATQFGVPYVVVNERAIGGHPHEVCTARRTIAYVSSHLTAPTNRTVELQILELAKLSDSVNPASARASLPDVDPDVVTLHVFRMLLNGQLKSRGSAQLGELERGKS